MAEVYQRINGVWTALYSLNSAQAGENNPSLEWLLSPEPFHYACAIVLHRRGKRGT